MKFLRGATLTFSNNKAYHDGGHIYNDYFDGTIIMRSRGTFAGGVATAGSGGAIHNREEASIR